VELSSVVLDAFLMHMEDNLRREWEAEQYAAEAAAWEPFRQRLAANRNAPTWAEQQELRRLPPPQKVTATPNWPPIAIPGRPGWWRHCIDGQQVDLPDREPIQKGAA